MGPANRRVVVIAGAAVGLALSLLYSVVINPIRLTNAYPALLRGADRRDWIRLAMLSFVAEGDAQRLHARLDGIEREEIEDGLQGLVLAEPNGHPEDVSRQASRVAQLVQLLDVTPPSVALAQPIVALAPSEQPTPSSAPSVEVTATPPLAPTATPTRASPRTTPGPVSPSVSATGDYLSALAFRVAYRKHSCQVGETPRIEVVVQDEEGRGLPNVRVWILWQDGADWAVTGLKPSLGDGYADFDVVPGVSYTLGLGEIGLPLVGGLSLAPCSRDGGEEPSTGTWRIVLKRRGAEPSATPTSQK